MSRHVRYRRRRRRYWRVSKWQRERFAARAEHLAARPGWNQEDR